MATSARYAETNGDPQQRVARVQTDLSEMKSDGIDSKQQVDASMSDTASVNDSASKSSTQQSNHRRFVLTDPVAFRYLEEDPSTTVLARRQKLEGYESYLVEQWACSRIHPTFIITTYTGDPASSIIAGVLSVPTDEDTWSPQLRVYFKALRQYHARERETNLGTLMITNLSSFPSSLTVIPIPDGDVKKHRELFFVNENLKRLGCSGRLGIKLAPPSGATQAKFHQLYRTSDKIPLNSSVIELVKLCQVALVLFGKLEPEYADGLLCDITEKAVNDWWVEFGTEYYNIEPHDGILGPTTVAALLGMLMGARNRLSAYNAPIAKDVFDVDSTKRGIAYFQKTQRLQKTRRLDRQTLERLRRATAKAASGEGWAMPRAVKSTVAELGGKGGEMVMGMVGGREKAGIADVETVDIDQFVELVHGERSKWLWFGKPRKHGSGDMFSRLPEDEGTMVFQKDDQGNYAWQGKKRESVVDEQGIRRRDTPKDDSKRSAEPPVLFDGFEKDPFSKRTAFRKATDRIEARSGFNRIKEVVGRRNHQQKPSKELNGRVTSQQTKSESALKRTSIGIPDSSSNLTKVEEETSARDRDSPASSVTSARRNGYPQQPFGASFTRVLTETPRESESTLVPEKRTTLHVDEYPELGAVRKPERDESPKPPTVRDSIAGSIYKGVDLTELFPLDEFEDVGILLRRTQSSEELGQYHIETRNDRWWPRHLSFSIAEESILTWPALVDGKDNHEDLSSPKAALDKQKALADDMRRMRERLALLSSIDGAWVEERISNVQDLNNQAEEDIAELEDMYYPRFDEYHALQEEAHEILERERSQLQDALKDLENLGSKLEYEINALRSKVDDVEDGVAEFEREVKIVEDRVSELEAESREKEGWGHWILRVTTGIGRPPAPPAAN